MTKQNSVSRRLSSLGVVTMLALLAFVAEVPRAASADTNLFYLHGTGAINNPPAVSMDQSPPSGSTARYRDSGPVSIAGGNPWRPVGTWAADPALTGDQLSSVGNADVWVGLKNSDDQGTRFDLRGELLKNGMVITTAQIRCVSGLVRAASSAVRISVPFTPFAPTTFNGTSDTLSLKISARIGTNASGAACGGHSNGTGLRLYFDAAGRPSSLAANFTGSTTPPRIYVTNTDPSANNVAVIDATTDAVIRTIAVGSQPRGIAASAVKHRVYAVNTYGSQSVSVIDTVTDSVIATIALGTTMAFNAALSNDGSRLYLSGYTPSDESLGANLTVIDTATNTVIHTLHGFRTGSAILVVSPDGSRVYYTDSNCCGPPHPNGFVRVIDTATYAVTDIEVGQYPVGIAISPNGARLYVANGAGDSLSIVDSVAGTVIDTLPTPPVPNGVAINPAGTRVYVTASSGSVMVLDTADHSTVATVPVTGNLTYAAVSADGAKLYVAGNDADIVTVLDTTTNAVIDTIASGFATPWAAAALP